MWPHISPENRVWINYLMERRGIVTSWGSRKGLHKVQSSYSKVGTYLVFTYIHHNRTIQTPTSTLVPK